MTRDEHLQWAKDRALAYLPHDPNEALVSMLSDLGKHEQLAKIGADLAPLGLFAVMQGHTEVRRFITGFN